MRKVETILRQVDMEVARTPSDLRDWVESKAEELCQTKEGRQYARSGESLPKKLWEELRPFGLFAFFRYRSRKDVRCTPNLGNENFDGRIDFDDSTMPSVYVEITYAKDGRDESLRFEVMNQTGSVNLLGAISVSGTKVAGSRRILVENEMVDHKETLEGAIKIVCERIVGKSRRTYGPNYELVVVIDDYLPFRTEEDRRILEDRARATINCADLDFGKIFLLGSSGNYLKQIYGNA